jgi:hypothetical protein
VARIDGLTSASVPVEIVALDGTGAAVTQGGTFLVGLQVGITRASDGMSWDFADSTFKASPTTAAAALTEYSASKVPGLFHLVNGWTPPDDDTYTFTISQVGGTPAVANVPATRTLFVGPEIGAATMGNNLVDELAVVADDLRDELHADFGVRQWSVYHIHARWSGGLVGVGSKSVTTISELIPSPKLVLEDTHTLTEGGLQETGLSTISEVSLTYSEDQLLGKPMVAGAEFFYVAVDKLGQGIQRRIFIPNDHPFPDRENTIGWTFNLRRVDGPPNVAVAYG